MNIQRINITLPETLLKELSFSVPTGKRSEFIAEAVSEKLGKKKNIQRNLKESLAMNSNFYAQVAKEWEATEISDWPQE